MRQLSVAAVLALPLLAGCAAQRVLEITSDPPGASVSIDGVAIEGVTPLEHRFEHYGVRRIILHKPGFQTSSDRFETVAPWYSRFPFDIFSEVLLPFGWRDTHRYEKRLVVGEDLEDTPTLRSVIERANLLRLAGPEGPRQLPSSTPPSPDDEKDPGGSNDKP